MFGKEQREKIPSYGATGSAFLILFPTKANPAQTKLWSGAADSSSKQVHICCVFFSSPLSPFHTSVCVCVCVRVCAGVCACVCLAGGSPPRRSSGPCISVQLLQGAERGAVQAAAPPWTAAALLAQRRASEGQHHYARPSHHPSQCAQVRAFGTFWDASRRSFFFFLLCWCLLLRNVLCFLSLFPRRKQPSAGSGLVPEGTQNVDK